MLLHHLAVVAAVLVGGATAKEGNCREARVPTDMCATLYDADDCARWSHDVPAEGYSELGPQHRNQAGAAVVRKGCKFAGDVGSFCHATRALNLFSQDTKRRTKTSPTGATA